MITAILKRLPAGRKIARRLGLLAKKSHNREFLLNMLPKHSTGVEIGVHRGDFSEQILRIVNPKELHLIDPWKHEDSDTYKEAMYGGRVRGGQAEMDYRFERVCARFNSEIRSRRVIVHRGYSSNVLLELPDGYFDWIYIDGNHLYEFVRKDLEISLTKTKPGGYITGDDYTDRGWWGGGVKKAVDEFVQVKSVQLAAVQDGQFVLRK